MRDHTPLNKLKVFAVNDFMRTAKLLVLILPLFLMQACSMGGWLPQRASNVQFLQRFDSGLDNCRRLGPISATGSGYYNMETGLSDAANQLRVSAAFLGGDTVVINTREGDDNLYTRVHAVAYRCS
jgi:hypothetical protein